MLTLQEIAQATHGKIINGDIHKIVRGVSIDNRKVKKSHLFIAIVGTRLDGHQFVKKAVQQGASVVLVSKESAVPKNISAVVVADTTKALGLLAGYYRKKFNIPVVAITGSAGKTTTKECVAHVLASKYKVLKSEKSENNHIGVPLTLFKLKPAHEVAVLELGTNRFGDIPWVASIAHPTIAIFTNIGNSHLAGLKNKAGVLKEKSSMLTFMPENATVIYNGDDLYLRKMKQKNRAKKFISFGLGVKNNFQARQVSFDMLHGNFKVKENRFQIATPSVSHVYNALAAIACGRLLNVPISFMRKKLKSFKGAHGRFALEKVRGFYLIDDTYNANPVSFDNAIKTFNALKIRGKKIVACADMLELGKRSRELHETLGKEIARSSVQEVYATGDNMKYCLKAIKNKNPLIKVCYDKKIANLQPEILKSLNQGDCILLKGSRSMHLEKVVDYLKK